MAPETPAKRKSIKSEAETKDSRETLLDAALQVFSKKGFDGATVKDIADLAKLNVSSISYYFQGKEGIYSACLERLGLNRLQLAESILTKPESPEDLRVKLKLFVNQMIESHLREEEAVLIIFRDLDCGRAETVDVFKRVFMKIFNTLETFLKEAQKAQLLSAPYDIHVLAVILWSPILHLLKNDHVNLALHGNSLKDPEYKKKFLENYFQLLTKGLIKVKS